MSDKLPKGWISAVLKDIVIHRKGKKPQHTISEERKGFIPYLLIDEMEGKPVRNYTDDIKVPIAEKSDVLIVWDGSIGKTATGLYGAIGSTIAALTPIIIQNNFLEYFLKTVKPFIEQTSRGTGLQHINPKTFWPMLFPLPPLNEQRRIVTKLDSIMPRIETVKERLEKIPVILKRFRQSVLTAAVTGKLTEKWREENPDIGKWRQTSLQELTNYITSGSRGWAKYYSDKGSIFIRAQNIKTDSLSLEDVAYVNIPQKTEGIRTKIEKFDILITITGANVTKTALVQNDILDAYVNQHVALVRLNNTDNSKFVYLWLISPNAGRLQLESAAYGAGKPGLNLDNIRKLQVEIPDEKEQKEIVKQVDKLFLFADKVETRYKAAKARVDKLSQSVLARAFRGELVPQNPDDEPAEKLLERILEEKTKLKSSRQKTSNIKKQRNCV